MLSLFPHLKNIKENGYPDFHIMSWKIHKIQRMAEPECILGQILIFKPSLMLYMHFISKSLTNIKWNMLWTYQLALPSNLQHLFRSHCLFFVRVRSGNPKHIYGCETPSVKFKNTILQSVIIIRLERQHKTFVYHESSNGEIPSSQNCHASINNL